jgi:hypothetical protein
MSEQSAAGPTDARDALASVAAMKAAARRRGAWPWWTALVVALNLGAARAVLSLQGTVETIVENPWPDVAIHAVLKGASLLPAGLVMTWLCVARRVTPRYRSFAPWIFVLAWIDTFFFMSTAKEILTSSFGAAGPLALGAAEGVAVLVAFAAWGVIRMGWRTVRRALREEGDR